MVKNFPGEVWWKKFGNEASAPGGHCYSINFVSDNKKTVINDEIILEIINRIEKFLEEKNIYIPSKNFNLEIKSEIPLGRGLGSSAALSAAFVNGYLKFFLKKGFDKEFINDLVYQIEKFFHKNPSGIDNTAVVYGGLIYYRKEFEFLKNIQCLPFKIPKRIEEGLYLVDSGKPLESTGDMVEYVKKQYQKQPNYFEEIFNKIEKVTKQMVISIKENNLDLFKKSLVDNQILLELLGVVSDNTKKLIRELNKIGIGKITGAGGLSQGSGYLIVYTEKKDQLKDFLDKKTIGYFKFIPSYQGVN